ncbi:MAG: tRNA (adenosine(37)-N6)-threonylcarbamoyltransferase complex dimerization subunit type 1 TsaB [Rhizomicrobium sp.]
MKLLAVDTALGACSVAVLDGDTVRAHRFIAMPRGHAEALAPMVEEVLREAGLGLAGVDRLAVTTGPGTFTGQRVGLAFMRGLRLALKRPLIGVTTLDAMAAAAVAESGRSWAAVLHEAKRGEVYATLVSAGKTVLPVQVAGFAAMMAEVEAAAGAETLAFAGTAAEAAANWYRERGGQAALTSIRQPDALWVARLAARAAEPSGVPKPLYLRPPDAKLPRQVFAASGGEVLLRHGDRRDSSLLAVLHAACFADAWSAPSFEQMLDAPGVFVRIAEHDGRAVGFALGRAAADEAELLSIGVLEAHRRTGLGRLLLERIALQAAELGAVSLFLEVAHTNEAARALYDRLGFQAVGTRRSYYREPRGDERDAFVLRAALPLVIPGLGNDLKID